LTTALKDASAENGTLAKAVKSVVVEAVKPLADEVDRLTKKFAVNRQLKTRSNKPQPKASPTKKPLLQNSRIGRN
jgi:hypothetical protein